MDDIAVPTLSSFLSNLDSSESVLVANSVDAQSPLMTQRSDSSEEEKAGAGTLQNKKKRSQFTSCDACVSARRGSPLTYCLTCLCGSIHVFQATSKGEVHSRSSSARVQQLHQQEHRLHSYIQPDSCSWQGKADQSSKRAVWHKSFNERFSKLLYVVFHFTFHATAICDSL